VISRLQEILLATLDHEMGAWGGKNLTGHFGPKSINRKLIIAMEIDVKD